MNSFLKPWVPALSYGSNLEDELRKEVTLGHPLYSLNVRAVAQRTDTDDVLFEVDSPDFLYAVVHLTWRGEPEPDARWPDTECFATFEEWVEKRMIPDQERAAHP